MLPKADLLTLNLKCEADGKKTPAKATVLFPSVETKTWTSRELEDPSAFSAPQMMGYHQAAPELCPTVCVWLKHNFNK